MDNPSLPYKIQNPHKITIYKNGKHKNLFYYFTWNKKVYRSSTGSPDLQTSINKSIEIFYQVSKGIGKPKKIYLKTLFNKFIEHKKNQGVSQRTINDYLQQSKYLIEYFKTEDVENLGTRDVYQRYQNYRRNYYKHNPEKQQVVYKRGNKKIKGRKFHSVGNRTLNKELRLLVSILKYGKEYEGLFKNIEIQPYTMLTENRREEILTKDEYSRLKEYWMNKNPYYWYIISFINNTGVRYPSELNNIKWKNVDFDKNSILIRDRKNKKKSQPINTPIPMIGTTREIIETLYQRNQEKGISMNPEDPVFVNDNGIQIKDIGKSFKKSLKKCGIDKNLTMYSLRHLYTTRMVKRPDIPLSMISYTLGHRDTTMVERVYSHLRGDDVVKTFENSENKKQEILNKEKKKIENEIDDKTKKLQEIKKQLDELISNE